MTWNHRIIFHRDKNARLSYFAVHECHYHKAGDAIPHSWTEEPIRLIEDSVDDMRVTLTRIRRACTKPVLETYRKKLVVYSTAQKESQQ